ncbi:MAG: squalene--hopene cyclase [Phycisphaeraceae bacterium]
MADTALGRSEPLDPTLRAGGPAAPVAPSTDLLARARQTLQAGVDHLLELQNDDGHWRAELEGDSILQSEYILLKWILGQENDARLPKIAAYLRRQQQPDGTWVQYPGGRIDISATTKGYFALKLMGDDPELPHMQRAREQVLAAGGAEQSNSFSKFYYAALGQMSWDAQPTIPPEIVYLPRSSYFHLDKVSSWTRTMMIPLSIVTTHRPVRELESDKSMAELWVDPANQRRLVPTQENPHPFWSRFFLIGDQMAKQVHKLGLTPWRKRAIQWMERWLLEHLEGSDGLGAIFPPMVYIQIAFRCLGYEDDHPVLVKARKDLDDLMIEDPETGEIRIQPCFSPVWDTGIAAFALTEVGLDQKHPAMRGCRDWLLSKECRIKGDWAANVDEPIEPSGWFFEYNNPFYPDTDDTAMVSMALNRIGGKQARAAASRGLAWDLAMQNDDGGWAAFDRTKERPLLEQVPFADHNAIQDPSCPDITGRVLESLGWLGMNTEDKRVQRAIAYIRETQEEDGAWFGRWGVNYIYGTYQVLVGLASVGQDMDADWVQRAGQWFVDHQNDDGSFGESPDSYEDPSLRGQGPSTASQTAWGAMGLLAVFGPEHPNVQRAIDWLCLTQLDSGNWHEPWFTGTGFPRVFYLRYHMYKLYFPVMAIGRWLRLQEQLPRLES